MDNLKFALENDVGLIMAGLPIGSLVQYIAINDQIGYSSCLVKMDSLYPKQSFDLIDHVSCISVAGNAKLSNFEIILWPEVGGKYF